MKTQQKERVHILRNTLYMLSVAWKCAPFGVSVIYISLVLYNVYYHAILPITLLKTALSIMEEGGLFRQFALAIGFAVVGKITVDLLDAITDYYIRIRFEIRCESAINAMLFKKAQEVELACYEDPVFYDKFTQASWVVEKGGFKRIIEGSAWTLGSMISYICVMIYLIRTDPFLLFFAVSPVFVMLFRTLRNKTDFEKEKAMTPYERKKDYVRRTVLLKDFAKDIKTTDIFKVLKKNFHRAVVNNIALAKKYGTTIAVYEMCSDLFGQILPVGGGFVYACMRLIGHGIGISDFSVLIAAVLQCRNSIYTLAYQFTSMQKQCLYVQAMRDFLRYEPKLCSGSLHPGDFETLELKDVSFRYPGAENDTLSHLSFCIEKGETLSVVGFNGAGKTTLSKLLMRLYDVTDGEILYNGVNIKEYDLAAYRAKFTSVFQDHKIFAMTVAENVLARQTNEADTETVKQALDLGGIKERIDRLPGGIHAMLTKEFDDAGISLSGGESQKLATARLFAQEAQIAVLDEPSSALDPIAEDRMYRNLQEAKGDRTILYISHRLSSAASADRILVMEEGKLVQSGDHRSLMQQDGIYSTLFALQASGYREEAISNA